MATVSQTLDSGQIRVLTLNEAPISRPSTVPAVFRTAARILAANGLFQGDFVPDAMDREMCIPHFLRPMSMVAALKCAVSSDPHVPSLLADAAISVLALRLEVDGEGPLFGGVFDLEAHVDAWGDLEGRTTESAVAVLEAAADGSEAVAL